MRPVILQEIMSWLKNENERTPCKEQRISFANWKLTISSIMPQQSAGSNACALYIIAAADILSSGGEVRFPLLIEKFWKKKVAETWLQSAILILVRRTRSNMMCEC